MQVCDIPISENQMETTRHGSAAFPLAVYRTVMGRNVLGFVNWHWHTALQFCLVTRGEIVFQVQQETYLLQQGDGIFVNSGLLHTARPKQSPQSTYICLDVEPPLLASFPGSCLEQQYLLPYQRTQLLPHCVLRQAVPWQRAILREIAEIDACCAAPSFGYELEVTARLLSAWRQLLLHAAPASAHCAAAQNLPAAQAILRYLSQHCCEHITLKSVAQAVGYTQSECCRIFKRATGSTIFSYLQSLRLTKSALLLLQTDDAISRVAYEAGFSSTSYFIGVFRAQFGQTPLQYRKAATSAAASFQRTDPPEAPADNPAPPAPATKAGCSPGP